MSAGLKSLLDTTLQSQIARLRNAVEVYKNRLVSDLKQQAIGIAVTAGLALAALIFLLIAVGFGFVALYVVVARDHGVLAGLGAAGGTALVLALILLGVAASRGGSSPAKPAPPRMPPAIPATRIQKPADLAAHAVNSASEVLRTGPREAVWATMAISLLVGIVLGRR